ncbi:MAG: CPBP family intramembrane metalloprotease [Chitinophagaceae bacterium]|nr:CPBP family intramembrane metalloprotease [Chitinophagaceae bacterium]
MTSNKPAFKPALIFLALVFALSTIFYSLIIHTGKLGSGFGMYVTGLMWCPGIAALLTCRILNRKISTLGWRWGKTGYQLQSYLVPALYALIAYLVIWIAGWGGFYNKEFISQVAGSFGLKSLPDGIVIICYTILMGIFGMAASIATALGEEIGWRGFLVPELFKSLGYTKTSFITGLVWSLWHYPILLFADYNSGTPAWYGLTCFTIMVISISFIFSWFRIKSGSLWTGAILHASHNLFIQSIFTPITSDTGNTKYYIDEFGAVLPIVALCFAVYFWSKRSSLSLQS